MTQAKQIRVTLLGFFSMGILASSGFALFMGRKAHDIASDMDNNPRNA